MAEGEVGVGVKFALQISELAIKLLKGGLVFGLFGEEGLEGVVGGGFLSEGMEGEEDEKGSGARYKFHSITLFRV